MWPWLFTAAGKRVILAATAIVALGGAFLSLRSHYIALGKQEDAAAALDSSAKQLAAQQQEFESRYAALESQRAVEAARSEELLVKTNKLAAQISSLESQRTRDHTSIASLPEPSLVPDLRRKLGVASASTAPDLLPPEIRAADTIVTDYPSTAAENRDLAASNQALASRAALLTNEITSVTAERDLSFNWGDAVFTQYRNCFDSFPRHRGFFARLCHVATFGLGCKPKKLSLVPPSAFAHQRPAKSASPQVSNQP